MSYKVFIANQITF